MMKNKMTLHCSEDFPKYLHSILKVYYTNIAFNLPRMVTFVMVKHEIERWAVSKKSTRKTITLEFALALYEVLNESYEYLGIPEACDDENGVWEKTESEKTLLIWIKAIKEEIVDKVQRDIEVRVSKKSDKRSLKNTEK